MPDLNDNTIAKSTHHGRVSAQHDPHHRSLCNAVHHLHFTDTLIKTELTCCLKAAIIIKKESLFFTYGFSRAALWWSAHGSSAAFLFSLKRSYFLCGIISLILHFTNRFSILSKRPSTHPRDWPLWDALGWTLAHALNRTCWRRSRDCQQTATTSHLLWFWGRAARARARARAQHPN